MLMDEYATASGSDPKEATIQLFQLPPDLHVKGTDIYRNLLGLLVDKCQTAWLQKQPVWVDKNTFTNRLHEDIAAYRMDRYLERPLFSTSYKEFLKTNKHDHLFLEQLQRLGMPEKICDSALEHYWGFYSERIRLQIEGDVLPSVWDARDQALHQRWQMIGDSVAIEADTNATEDSLAKRTFAKTINGSYTASLGNHATTQPYFTSGNYHNLANQPDHACFVYWHLSYKPQKKDDE